jgi:hypothetical protein
MTKSLHNHTTNAPCGGGCPVWRATEHANDRQRQRKRAADIRAERKLAAHVRPVKHAPTEAAARKALPLCTGVLDYFPDALLEVAAVSKIGNDQHNPGQPLHWDKSKSTDEADCILRHLVDRGTRDSDGARHSAKVAWRALALLQREIDAEKTDATE